MTRWEPVSWSRHGQSQWLEPRGCDFAQAMDAVPMVRSELAGAIAQLPLFVAATEGGRYELVGLCGLQRGENLFVGAKGRWRGGYVPAWLRMYPFRMASTQPDRRVFCVDADSNLVEAFDGTGTPFFAAEGELSELTEQRRRLAAAFEYDRQRTRAGLAALAEAQVLVPATESEQGGRPLRRGLYQIDEKRLAALDDEQVLELRRVDALRLAYAQRFSLNRMDTLRRLYGQTRRQERQTLPEANELFGDLDDGLDFDWDQLDDAANESSGGS